jgi:hypothetical protein
MLELGRSSQWLALIMRLGGCRGHIVVWTSGLLRGSESNAGLEMTMVG